MTTRRILGIIIAGFTGLTILVAIVTGFFPSCDPPEIVAEVRSEAVSFELRDTVNLVERARPRLGVVRGDEPFVGMSLTLQSARALVDKRSAAPSAAVDTSEVILRALRIAAGCRIVFEPRVPPRVNMNVEFAGDSTGPCDFYADLQFPDAAGDTPTSFEVRDTVTAMQPVQFVLLVRDTVRFRHVPVRALSFLSRESGQLHSTVTSGALTFPRYPANSTRLLHGDSVLFGTLAGTLPELEITNAVTLWYRGTATRPRVGARSLRPSFRDQIRTAQWFELVLAVLTLVAGSFIPIADRVLGARHVSDDGAGTPSSPPPGDGASTGPAPRRAESDTAEARS